ncbi:Glucose-6-phosphate 1-dehydrogenase [Patulibacter medicamentivorans]|uniref:Glucose-6-phosphate 1-dehydrogenase n=1 Tax=Patulibacter medicamentivorans TaxID=1097667 RepID=H0E418_9ACTN|nr:glucose-6-phosphate dehydrogenase [Patulibacter medicamentivorans]EHN11583.1 Glucose-6-phosphate 1-dehydrogenase [Patulibacter medicamentivorans]
MSTDTPPETSASQALPADPLAEGLDQLPPPSSVLVIFGATGDLARRKLLPALYNLAHEGSLPERFQLIGVSRGELTDDGYRDEVRQAIERFSRRPPDATVLDALLENVFYVTGGFEEDDAYRGLAQRLGQLDAAAGQPLNRIFYLSTAPRFFGAIVGQIGGHGLARREGADTRVVIEKPFGTTETEALELNRRVLEVLHEEQVFRIDHYLGKETVQNLLALRFANGLFEPIWNRNHIASVQITAGEAVGLEGRAGYYDGAGALRDLVQNHLLQLLCILAMEPPTAFAADDIRGEKVKILRAIERIDRDQMHLHAVRGRYGAGAVGGDVVPAYVNEPDVPASSTTETFVALRLQVDTWRWAGVPFYIRTGKRLSRKLTEIAVTLQPVPHLAFHGGGTVEPNQIVFTIQPDEHVSIKLAAKVPGSGMHLRPVTMDFSYGTSFLSTSPEAYERLITDALRGDATLFTRADEVEAQWAVIQPILDAWAADASPPDEYAAGSDGPQSQQRILRDGDHWRAI